MKIIHRLSKIFQPYTPSQKNIVIKNIDQTSTSQRLLVELGIVRQANPGSHHLLPLGMRSLQKLCNIIDEEMILVDGQKVQFPTLTHADLWKSTKRYNENESELFLLTDRHNKKYLLSPTYEEAAADLLSTIGPLSYKHYPLRFYQISSKFRDEIKPRFGIMRGREFIMKDLYSFDVDVESAKKTYNTMCNAYDNVFRRIGVPFIKVLGSTGTMGGSLSHEYHFPAPIGEDRLLICNNCNYSANLELLTEEKCPNCTTTDNKVKIVTGIEVGHTFFLGEKYSRPLNASCISENTKPIVLQMGSYGLGISRILAASVESLCLPDEIRWPTVIAPFKVVLISPKDGSKEQLAAKQSSEQIYEVLNKLPTLSDDVLLDDRNQMTIGKRLVEAKRMGYPFIVVLGKLSMQEPPQYEIINLNSKEQYAFTMEQMVDFFSRFIEVPAENDERMEEITKRSLVV